MSKYSNDKNNDIDNEEYEEDLGELESNLDKIPESQPDFTREPGKKTPRGFNPEVVQDASQIPTARFITTQRGPVINIDNQTFEVTQFRPEIIDQIRRRQQEETRRPPLLNSDYPLTNINYSRDPRDQEYYTQTRNPSGHLGDLRDPRDLRDSRNYVEDYHDEYNKRESHDRDYSRDSRDREYYQQPKPIHTKAAILEQQREGKGKVIDLTDKDLSLVDDGSSYPRTKPNMHNTTIFSPLFNGWNKSGLIFILIFIFMNPYTQNLIFNKIPYLTNVYALLIVKCIFIVILWHLINGYMLH